jgi:ketosteroid isomerase-like protein
MMGEHPSAALYRRVIEAVSQGEMAAFVDALADDVVWHQIGAPSLKGKQAVIESLSAMEGADFEVDIHDVLANDDHLVGLVEAHVKVGDQEITYRTAEIAHVEDGKVTERWAFSDDTQAIAEFFSQFG